MKSKVLRFLLSLVIALGIWVYVVTVVSPESETTIHQIPVLLDGENILSERNLMIVSDKSFAVDLKLFGNRVDLNKLTSSNITILANLAQIYEPGEHTVRYSIAYPSVVEQGNVDALERNPQYITLTVAEKIWKEIPVEISYSGTVKDGYVVDGQNYQLDHTTITISGPKEAVERVDHAAIQVDLTGRVDTIVDTFFPTLCTASGQPLEETDVKYADKVTSNISEIRATIKIQKIKELPIRIEVIAGGGLGEADVALQPSLDTIVVSGNDAVLDNLEELVVGKIELSDLVENTQMEFEIVMPAGVTNETGITKLTVDVTLLQELEIRTFTVTEFRLENIPANRQVKVVNREIQVHVRGTKEALDALSAEDIIAVVDCTDAAKYGEASVWLNVTIQILDKESLGAVGSYRVLAEVSTSGSASTGG